MIKKAASTFLCSLSSHFQMIWDFLACNVKNQSYTKIKKRLYAFGKLLLAYFSVHEYVVLIAPAAAVIVDLSRTENVHRTFSLWYLL